MLIFLRCWTNCDNASYFLNFPKTNKSYYYVLIWKYWTSQQSFAAQCHYADIKKLLEHSFINLQLYQLQVEEEKMPQTANTWPSRTYVIYGQNSQWGQKR